VGQTLAELGEFAVIDRIKNLIPTAPDLLVGVGDDAAVLNISGSTVASVDTLIEGKHFKPEWCSATDVGHRAAAAAMADVAAMGGHLAGILVSLAAPADTPIEWVEDVISGAVAECEEAGAQVIGGDLAQSDTVMISVTALGSVPQGRSVTRAGAQPGDVLAIAGRQGWAAAGLTMLSRGFRSPRALVNAYQRPLPPFSSGPDAAAAGATAMIDVSDGLLADLRHIAMASNVLIDLDSEAMPVADQLVETSAAFNVDPLTWVLGGGDDHALVATFPAAARLPELFTPVGRVAAVTDDGQPGVSVDGRVWNGVGGGHDHFR
jgi:thiamine-monophosphate kinase